MHVEKYDGGCMNDDVKVTSYTYEVDIGLALCVGPVDHLHWIEVTKAVADRVR